MQLRVAILFLAFVLTAHAAAPVANNDANSVSEDGILVVNAGGTGGSVLAGGGAFGVVPEAANYTLVYEMAIPNNLVVSASVPFPYTVNNSETVGGTPFDRVAYYFGIGDQSQQWQHLGLRIDGRLYH